MQPVLGLCLVALAIFAFGAQRGAAPRSFDTAVQLETTSEDSANVSMGDLDGDGDLDLVLAKGRHTPLLDKVLINDGRGALRRFGPRAHPGPHLHRRAGRSRRRRRSRRADEQRHARPETRLPEQWQGAIHGCRHVGRCRMVDTKRGGGRSQWRRETRCHRRQPARPELRVPQSGRRTLRRRLHPHPRRVRHEHRAGRLRQGRLHRSRGAEPRRRAESHLLQRRQGRVREDGAVRSRRCRRTRRRRRGLQPGRLHRSGRRR